MKTLTISLALSVLMLLSGCAIRAQYTQDTQTTWAVALLGIGSALLAALTIVVLVGGGK